MENIENLLEEALSLCQSGHIQEGEKIYLHLLELAPENTRALSNLGSIALHSGDIEQAIGWFTKSLRINQNQPVAYYSYGMALQRSGQFENAFKAYDSAISLKHDFTEAYNNRALTLSELKRHEEALTDFNRAIQLNPNYVEAYNNRALTLSELKRHEEALTDFNRAIQLNPNYAEAYNNRGMTFNELRHFDEALADFGHAIELNPDYSETYNNRGMTFSELRHFDEALADFGHAIQLNPDYAETYNNRGLTFSKLKRYDEALADFAQAMHLKPELDYLLGSYIRTKMELCDWGKVDTLVNQLADKIFKNKKVITPWATLGLIDNLELQKQSAAIFINNNFPVKSALPIVRQYRKHQKIRIGYFSADFHEHPLSFLTVELFELHNRNQFEVIAFSFDINTNDVWRQRLEIGFDKFIDVRDKSDTQIVSLAREMEIDIAVDLGGFTAGSRTGIFAARAAPIQVNYLGYAGTMYAEYMDYIIADSTLIPNEKQCYYSEKVAYIPGTYMVNDSSLQISEKVFSRKEFELPEKAFIFACFNASYKITPVTFLGWMRILGAVEHSVLWLTGTNKTAMNNLKNLAEENGVDKDRIIFTSRVPLRDHLNRIRLADLFLDTFPYNAHTTCNDALRVGLPVLTLMGESFASRVAASLLNAVNLPELITTNQHEYESLAINLAAHTDKLAQIKNKLKSNLKTSPLCNTKLFAQHIESLYQLMYQRHQNQLIPDHIYINK